MTITEKRFNELQGRVNGIGKRVAAVEGALEIKQPEQQTNTVLITLLSVAGLAVIAYGGWLGVEVVNREQFRSFPHRGDAPPIHHSRDRSHWSRVPLSVMEYSRPQGCDLRTESRLV